MSLEVDSVILYFDVFDMHGCIFVYNKGKILGNRWVWAINSKSSIEAWSLNKGMESQ
jgi:hypothetical protein